MSECYITEKECEYYVDEECLAVFEEQCPIACMSDEELKEQALKEVQK